MGMGRPTSTTVRSHEHGLTADVPQRNMVLRVNSPNMAKGGLPPDEAIEELAQAELLTRKQAQAFVYREIEATPREATADHLEISPNTLDEHLAVARRKVDNAHATVNALTEIRGFEEQPE